jgi:hypothetical protein
MTAGRLGRTGSVTAGRRRRGAGEVTVTVLPQLSTDVPRQAS